MGENWGKNKRKEEREARIHKLLTWSSESTNTKACKMTSVQTNGSTQ